METKFVDLSKAAGDGIISREAAEYIFKLGTNWLGEFYSLFPDNVKNGDSFSCDGKVYQMINGEILHTGFCLYINNGTKDNTNG